MLEPLQASPVIIEDGCFIGSRCIVVEGVVVNEWVKQAILLYFAIQPMQTWEMPPFEFYDKMLLKKDYKDLGVRAVPHAIARYGSYLAKNVVLMPSYVNIGAYVDEGTMVDTWATVGSCAQIGKGVHLSGGVGLVVCDGSRGRGARQSEFTECGAGGCEQCDACAVYECEGGGCAGRGHA